MHWAIYAVLSALFAGMTALLAKIGVENVPSNLATLIRTVVILLFAAAIVVARGEGRFAAGISQRTWLFLVLSGFATGLSWLCYFAALKAGPISGVAPIDKLSFVIAMVLAFVFLREKISGLTWAGAALICAGVLLTLTPIQEAIRARFAPPAAPATRESAVK